MKSDSANFIMMRDESIRPDNLKNLLPMNPYAVYFLKFIAQAMSSNQRTMLQFLCGEGDNSLKKFIESHEFQIGGDNYLTTAFLWDYFFHEDNLNIDRNFSEAMGFYNNFYSSCKTETQRRILKATLILFALQQYIGEHFTDYNISNKATSLLRSTKLTILACFAGTPIEKEVFPTLKYFAERDIVITLEESDYTYYIMATMPTDYLQYRLNIEIISPTKFFETGVSNVQFLDNHILAFYVFAKDEEEQGKVNQVIQKLRGKFTERCIIADLSGTPFTRQRYQKFIQNESQARYFKDIPNRLTRSKIAEKSDNVVGRMDAPIYLSECDIHRFHTATLDKFGSNGYVVYINRITESIHNSVYFVRFPALFFFLQSEKVLWQIFFDFVPFVLCEFINHNLSPHLIYFLVFVHTSQQEVMRQK